MLPYLLLTVLISLPMHAADTPSSQTGMSYQYPEILSTRSLHYKEETYQMLALPESLTGVANEEEHNPYRVAGGFFWGHRVMARHLFRSYTMYNANKRSQICEKDNGPCMTRIGAQDWEPDHYFDENYSEKKLSEKEKLQAKLGASGEKINEARAEKDLPLLSIITHDIIKPAKRR